MVAAPSDDDTYYPGSALTASRWLMGHRPPEQFEIRLTEGDKETCDALRRALVIPEDQIKQGSYELYLDWLTKEDNLVLLVDPFGDRDQVRGIGGLLRAGQGPDRS